MTTPALSIVVPTVDRRESVLRLLRALETQTVPPSDFEVIVVVDGSADDTAEAVDAYRAPFALRHLSLPRSGLASARNAGARAAGAPIVQFLDDDMEPAPGMVAAHLARHRQGDAVGVVGAAPIVVPPAASPVVHYRARGFARKLERLAARRDQLAFNDVYGGNVSIVREAFLAAGGYDETFRVYGHEDYELSLRLTRAGHRFVYSPDALANQYYDKSLRGLAADVQSEGRTAVLFARKHPEVLASLGLGRFRHRSRVAQIRLGAIIALSLLRPTVPERLVASVERLERHASLRQEQALFARYDRLFDALYWIGAERALRDNGVPWWRLAVRDVPRWLGATA
jgi:GT2 family glycosyltransferase